MCVLSIRCTHLFMLWRWHTLQDPALIYRNECKSNLPKSYFLHFSIFCGSRTDSSTILAYKFAKILDFVSRLELQKYNLCVCVYIYIYVKLYTRVYKDKLKRTGCLSSLKQLERTEFLWNQNELFWDILS